MTRSRRRKYGERMQMTESAKTGLNSAEWNPYIQPTEEVGEFEFHRTKTGHDFKTLFDIGFQETHNAPSPLYRPDRHRTVVPGFRPWDVYDMSSSNSDVASADGTNPTEPTVKARVNPVAMPSAIDPSRGSRPVTLDVAELMPPMLPSTALKTLFNGQKHRTYAANGTAVSLSFQISDSDFVRLYLYEKLFLLQQHALKILLKELIKAICPKKQAKYPYQSTAIKTRTGAPPQPAGWWTHVELCPYREPDHLNREQRVFLAVHLLLLFPTDEQLEEWNGPGYKPNKTFTTQGWAAFLRELLPLSIFDRLTEPEDKTARRGKILGAALDVVQHVENFQQGGLDGNFTISWQPDMSVVGLDKKSKKRARRDSTISEETIPLTPSDAGTGSKEKKVKTGPLDSAVRKYSPGMTQMAIKHRHPPAPSTIGDLCADTSEGSTPTESETSATETDLSANSYASSSLHSSFNPTKEEDDEPVAMWNATGDYSEQGDVKFEAHPTRGIVPENLAFPFHYYTLETRAMQEAPYQLHAPPFVFGNVPGLAPAEAAQHWNVVHTDGNHAGLPRNPFQPPVHYYEPEGLSHYDRYRPDEFIPPDSLPAHLIRGFTGHGSGIGDGAWT